MCSYDICAHISVNISCTFSICFTAKRVLQLRLHVSMPPVSEAAFSFHPLTWVINYNTKGTRPRNWKETAVSRGHGSCLRSAHLSSSSVPGSQKSGKSARCKILMQFGCKLRVFALGFFGSFSGYANILTLIFLHYVLLCLGGRGDTPALC